jgi:hypothetical protein
MASSVRPWSASAVTGNVCPLSGFRGYPRPAAGTPSSPRVMPGPCAPRMRLVARLDLSCSRPVARFVLRADVSRIGMVRDTGNAVREVVQDPNDPGVGSLGFGVFDGR